MNQNSDLEGANLIRTMSQSELDTFKEVFVERYIENCTVEQLEQIARDSMIDYANNVSENDLIDELIGYGGEEFVDECLEESRELVALRNK